MASTDNRSVSSRRKSRRAVLGLWLLVALGLLFAVLMRFDFHSAIGSSVKDRSEKREDARGEDYVVLACPGRVEGITEAIDVGAGMDGVLTQVRVEEGQQVAAGEVLALIACDDQKAELQAARAASESAYQSRQRLLRGSREEERKFAAEETVAAKAVLEQAQSQRRRMAVLLEDGVVSREAFEKADRDLDVAQAVFRASMSRKELTDAPPLAEELAKADAEVKAAEDRVRVAIARVEKCQIKAPIKGSVLRRYLKVGETVSLLLPRPVVSIADISRLRVRAEVDERDIGRVYLGQPVVVLTDAFSEKKFAGKVSWIGALMGRKKVQTGDPKEKSDRDVLEVLVDLGEKEDRLVVNLRTTVQFVGENHKDTKDTKRD